MKRVFLTLLLVAAAAFSMALRADAITELCPAAVSQLNALDAGPGGGATLFSYELGSLSAETVSGTLSIDTDAGWYRVAFGPMALTDRLESYSLGKSTFSRRSYYSAPHYVRFPSALLVKHAFVSTISTDDTAFSWPTKVDLECDNVDDIGAPLPVHPSKGAGFVLLQPHVALLALPDPGASVGLAAKTAAFDNLGCATPFGAPSASNMIQPDYPSTLRDSGLPVVTVMVAVILDPNGKIADDWVWVSSGNANIDRAAMQAAEQSTYTPAISRCKPVPSTTIFRADFTPDS